ncbi:MAG: DNA repair protein RecN [Gammaproteobacteria bacterium]|nr:DNA repair protein RecN [Gammaproteobacteria bacterium]
MLKHLRIQNFAIIDELELEFGPGMTALTGETGAGKSILLDALGLVLGDRADSNSLREGSQRAEICATFDIRNHVEANQWLQQQALDCDRECILRRVISLDGPSKAFINGSPVTLQSIRELAEMLVTIHGQHEHQALLKRDIQRQRLDDYAGNQSLLEKVNSAYAQWHEQQTRLNHLQSAEQDRTARLELLRFQAQEFELLALVDNEWSALLEEHQRLAHASKLLAAATEALTVIYDDDESLHHTLSQQQQHIQESSHYDATLNNIAESLSGALIQIDEAAGQLRDYLSDLDLDPGRLEWLEDRMGAIHDLARKHRVEPEQLPDVAAMVTTELSDLEHADERIESLTAECARLRQAYVDTANMLSQARHRAAEQLSKAVSASMETLGMKGGQFQVELSARTINIDNGDGFSVNGIDIIEYQVSANPGQSLKPLSKVASGGELSRISLAIQMITASNEPIPSLIFDEVDAGVGGRIAEIVGNHLRQLGEQRQVFCVTHLAQVASQAHNHFRVLKLTVQDAMQHTQTRVIPLNEEERINEIARMLGGVEITETTRNHAEEMIDRARRTLKNSA